MIVVHMNYTDPVWLMPFLYLSKFQCKILQKKISSGGGLKPPLPPALSSQWVDLVPWVKFTCAQRQRDTMSSQEKIRKSSSFGSFRLMAASSTSLKTRGILQAVEGTAWPLVCEDPFLKHHGSKSWSNNLQERDWLQEKSTKTLFLLHSRGGEKVFALSKDFFWCKLKI